jgi:pSer/pThr/pTyr-binding forkhead associated (FHA) protein
MTGRSVMVEVRRRSLGEMEASAMSEDPGTRRMPAPAVPDESETAPPAEPRLDDQEHTSGAAVLVVSRGPQAGKRIRLGRSRVQLGRSAACDVVLEDSTVSRQHARIDREGGHYVVTDVGSLNGTYVNRTPVNRAAVLNDGDEIRIGIFRLVFHV